MKDNEKREILEALGILNKYRNFFHHSSDSKKIKISNMIDKFLPEFYNEIVEDELTRMVIEKINKQIRQN